MAVRVEEWMRFGTAYIALNAPIWVLGHWLFISRPFFNVELVLPLLVAAWSLPGAALTLLVLWALDLTVSVALSYHFVSPLEFLRSVRFLSEVEVARFVTADRAAIVSLFIASAALAFWCSPRRRVPWPSALTVVAILVVLDIANGSSVMSHSATRLIARKFANSPVSTLVKQAWNEQQPRPLRVLPIKGSAAGVANIPAWAESHPDGSVLLVIVESMGWHNDPRLRNWLREQLFGPSLKPIYSLSAIAVPFRGSTTAAELRELCGLYGSYRLMGAEAGAGCLPALLAQRGWTTMGMHGFSRHMFDRKIWWPLLGLQTRLFADELTAPGSKRCGGAFAGVCDATLVESALVEARLPRRMVYALTLNSHLPLAPVGVPADLQQSCNIAATGDDVCRLTATVGIALRALRDGLARPGPLPEVIVVGDHAPPFIELHDRQQYSADRVPAFILSPKDTSGH